MAFENDRVWRIANLLDKLATRYPGRSLINIMYDAGNLSGRMVKHSTDSELEGILKRYWDKDKHREL